MYPPEAKTLIFNLSGSGTDPTLISASEAPYTILDFYLGQDAPGGNNLYCNNGFYSGTTENLWSDFTTFRSWFQHYPINYVCNGRIQFSDIAGTNSIISITYISGNRNAITNMSTTSPYIISSTNGNQTNYIDIPLLGQIGIILWIGIFVTFSWFIYKAFRKV